MLRQLGGLFLFIIGALLTLCGPVSAQQNSEYDYRGWITTSIDNILTSSTEEDRAYNANAVLRLVTTYDATFPARGNNPEWLETGITRLVKFAREAQPAAREQVMLTLLGSSLNGRLVKGVLATVRNGTFASFFRHPETTALGKLIALHWFSEGFEGWPADARSAVETALDGLRLIQYFVADDEIQTLLPETDAVERDLKDKVLQKQPLTLVELTHVVRLLTHARLTGNVADEARLNASWIDLARFLRRNGASSQAELTRPLHAETAALMFSYIKAGATNIERVFGNTTLFPALPEAGFLEQREALWTFTLVYKESREGDDAVTDILQGAYRRVTEQLDLMGVNQSERQMIAQLGSSVALAFTHVRLGILAWEQEPHSKDMELRATAVLVGASEILRVSSSIVFETGNPLYWALFFQTSGLQNGTETTRLVLEALLAKFQPYSRVHHSLLRAFAILLPDEETRAPLNIPDIAVQTDCVQQAVWRAAYRNPAFEEISKARDTITAGVTIDVTGSIVAGTRVAKELDHACKILTKVMANNPGTLDGRPLPRVTVRAAYAK